MNPKHVPDRFRHSRTAGFSLLELLVAMALFLVISATVFGLYATHLPVFSQQQDLAGLNIGLRNALSQLQIDLSNAGTGFYVGADIPNFPVGVTLINNPATSSCYTASTNTYSTNCFDKLNVIATDPNVPPIHPTSQATQCVSTTSSTLDASPALGQTAAQTASNFLSGDQLLLLKGDGSQLTTVVLTKNGMDSGGKVHLEHNPTGANGTNTSANDPLGISTNPNNKLGTQFCGNDWILKIIPITYSVDTSDPTNPKLVRTQAKSSSVVSEQIIGFKVGASLWNNSAGTSSNDYYFDASTYTYDYTLVRSVRVSLIGRTAPAKDPNYKFRNTFDGGPYQIQSVSVVVNPRNLSMKD